MINTKIRFLSAFNGISRLAYKFKKLARGATLIFGDVRIMLPKRLVVHFQQEFQQLVIAFLPGT